MTETEVARGPAAGSRSKLSPAQLTIAWHSASLLLGCPDEQLVGQLETIHRVSHHLPDDVGGPLRATVVHLESVPVAALQAEYLDTFHDERRRELHLVTHVRPAHQDHLCAVLEYAATVDQDLGGRLLREHAAALELLRTSLTESGSGWAGAVAAVLATLPSLRDDEPAGVRRDLVG